MYRPAPAPVPSRRSPAAQHSPRGSAGGTALLREPFKERCRPSRLRPPPPPSSRRGSRTSGRHGAGGGGGGSGAGAAVAARGALRGLHHRGSGCAALPSAPGFVVLYGEMSSRGEGGTGRSGSAEGRWLFLRGGLCLSPALAHLRQLAEGSGGAARVPRDAGAAGAGRAAPCRAANRVPCFSSPSRRAAGERPSLADWSGKSRDLTGVAGEACGFTAR